MISFSRRAFLGTMAVLAGESAASTGLLRRKQRYAQFGGCCELRVRQNILSLDECQLASLKRGIEVMKSRPASDPTSWRFQANIHGTVDTPADPLWNQCEHWSIQFLTWHRAYLYFFERILRAAACDPCLTLPYWDWYSSPSLPLAYRQPASSSNPLYDGTRNPAINAGGALPNSVVVSDTDDALAEIDFWPWPGFSDKLEGSPHGAVHGIIGGNMGTFEGAGNDPCFWLHHGNIDRLWDKWLSLNAGRENPTDPAFLDKQYMFADECGQTVTIRVGDYLYSCCLGYCYDDVCPPQAVSYAVAQQQKAVAQKESQVVASSLPGIAIKDVPQEAQSITLGFSAHTAKLSPIEGATENLKAVDASSARLALDIQEISFAHPLNYTYGVYLNLPEGAQDEATMQAHYVGAISFFGRRHHGVHVEHGPTTFTQTLDATRAAGRLRAEGKWNADAMTVTLRPLTATAPQGMEEQQRRFAESVAEKAKVSYKRIVLRTVSR